jgi:alginate O-acetyltransferase complex protein AlgI
MLFNSYVFLGIFLPCALLLVITVQQARSAEALLITVLFLSAIFYCYSSWQFFLLLIFSISVNYALSASLPSRVFVTVGIIFNLSLLAFFKYAGFLGRELQNAGLDVPIVSIGLPLAISFYTFKQISFLLDVNASRVTRPPLLQYASYVTFFPHLIAGPIVRFSEISGRLSRELPFRITTTGFKLGFIFLSFGLAKKVAVADTLARNADYGFQSLAAISTLEAWVALLSFSLQIYFDFSGYSDIAIGLALMFGIRLPDNFRSPYRATNVSDFWRRWHISLSRFLRDYLYLPLGGNRRGRLRTVVNLFVVMGLGGLWHGANWTFLIWGLLHGVYLSIYRLWQTTHFRLPAALAWALTFSGVTLAWVFFRSPDFSHAMLFLNRMFDSQALILPPRLEAIAGGLSIFQGARFGDTKIATLTDWLIIGLALAAVLTMPSTKSIAIISRGRALWAVACGFLLGVSTILLLEKPSVFIYFNF